MLRIRVILFNYIKKNRFKTLFTIFIPVTENARVYLTVFFTRNTNFETKLNILSLLKRSFQSYNILNSFKVGFCLYHIVLKVFVKIYIIK